MHILKKVRNVWCAFGNAFFQQNIGTLEMKQTSKKKQTSGLARGRHSWHGGGVAEGNWIKKFRVPSLNIKKFMDSLSLKIAKLRIT